MKIGLLTFPCIVNTFSENRATLLAQRLEPSVLYLNPTGDCVFIENNQPQENIDLYLCSVYTRGWEEFKQFSAKVGRSKIIAGGYHPTACPEETLPFAEKVVVGYCSNIDEIIAGPVGIITGKFGFTPMRRDLLDMKNMRQVYPDIMPDEISGSMVTSVGCPYDCDFCSTPNMSGRKMQISAKDYIEQEITDLVSRQVSTVFIRDESFATHPKMKEIAPLFKDKFRVLYSFGTGAVMAQRPELIRCLVDNGWHSLNFGLEDIGEKYRKNINLKLATENCKKNGMKYVMSFIVNDDGKDIHAARANYKALYEAFCDLGPSQVCANFLMPFPGTKIWNTFKDRITEGDFDKFDSKTPIFCESQLKNWHKQMLVAVQLKYYISDAYKKVRNFECGDTLFLRMQELSREFGLDSISPEKLLDI
jgi:radical SAM superfamily enzyme YgiQ (UPF0313 family)